jgi:DNA-binding beta-propeller fold protein YncE
LKRAGALLVALLLVATSATAATTGGAPRFEACVGAGGGCAKPPAKALDGVAALAVAPDGRHLYAAGFASDAVSALRVGARGRLRFDGCVADGGAALAGCATAPEGTLQSPAGLAVGGGGLYVASQGSDAVTRLGLRGGGRPTFRECVAAAGEACATKGAAALRGPTALALGPGGRDLYVASGEGGSVARLRAGEGRLRAAGCLAYAGAFGCRRVRKNSLVGADGIAVAPDGRAAYAVAFDSAAVTELGRSASGALTYRGCIGDRGVADCRGLRRGTLAGAAGVATAPDGRDLYVASQVGTVTRFAVTRGGRLAFSGCIGDGGLAGCAPAPRRLLAGATGLAIAPDGRTLYVAAKGADAIVELSTAGAAPSFLGCVRAGGGNGCASAPATSLRGAYALAGAPDGRSLYAGASGSGAVGSFDQR